VTAYPGHNMMAFAYGDTATNNMNVFSVGYDPTHGNWSFSNGWMTSAGGWMYFAAVWNAAANLATLYVNGYGFATSSIASMGGPFSAADLSWCS
jgi:hypothetical protein